MHDYNYDYLDKVMHVALSNLYTKREHGTNIVRLTNFSFKNKSHLTVLKIAQMAHEVLGLNIELCTDPFTYYFYNLKYKYRKFCKRTKNTNGIDTSMFIYDIESANNIFYLFNTIYEAYFERKPKVK